MKKIKAYKVCKIPFEHQDQEEHSFKPSGGFKEWQPWGSPMTAFYMSEQQQKWRVEMYQAFVQYEE